MSKRRRRSKKRGVAAKAGGPEGRDLQRTGRRGRDDPKGKKDQETKKDKKSKKAKKPKSAARNFVETVLVVVVLVLVMRWFLIEAFKIPSSSMEPTLLGHPYHGDRVLAWKPSVSVGSPPRWSVVVFEKVPDRAERVRGQTEGKNFIKRVVGLPGEGLMLAGGDVFTRPRGAADYAIRRKPKGVQEDVWHEVYESSHDRVRNGPPRWEVGEGLAYDRDKGAISGRSDGAAWARFAVNHYEGDEGLVTNLYVRRMRVACLCPGCSRGFEADIGTSRTRVDCPGCGREIDVSEEPAAAGPRTERFQVWVACSRCNHAFEAALPALRVRVACPGCGNQINPAYYPATREEEVPVADLRVSVDVRPARSGGACLARIDVGDSRFLARVPLAGGEARVTGPHDIDATGHVDPFEPGRPRRISFAHVDQALVLSVGGREVIRSEYSLDWRERAGGPRTNSVRIGLEGATAAFERLRIERDLHYLPMGHPGFMEFCSAKSDYWGPGLAADLRVGAGAARTHKELERDEFIMLGDNSPSSYDSRMWGPVRKDRLVGRSFFVFWPPNRIRWMP